MGKRRKQSAKGGKKLQRQEGQGTSPTMQQWSAPGHLGGLPNLKAQI